MSRPPATGWSGMAATATAPPTSSGCSTGLGLKPEITEAELRMESGAPVTGLVVRATKDRP